MLWHQIQLDWQTNLEHLQLVIERSEGHDLHVSVSTGGLRHSIAAAMLKESHRISSFKIDDISKKPVSLIRSLYPHGVPAPKMLEYTEGIPIYSSADDPYPIYVNQGPEAHSLLVCFNPPNLKTLQFTPTPDGWKALSSYGMLRDLRIIAFEYAQASVRDILRALHGLPLLQNLYLDLRNPYSIDPIPLGEDNAEVTELPMLQTLMIRGDIIRSAAVLTGIISSKLTKTCVLALIDFEILSTFDMCVAAKHIAERIAGEFEMRSPASVH